jgi:hypothetical protein
MVRPDDTFKVQTVERGEDFALKLVFKPHVEFLVQGPDGRRTGYDPVADTTYYEMPGDPYGFMMLGARNGGSHMEWTDAGIHNPLDGDYLVTVTKIFHPWYIFSTTYRDFAGDNIPTSTVFKGITIDTIATHSFTVTYGTIPYAPFEVTGGFAGSENEAVEIDRLLSYVSVAEKTTALAAGTDTFNLFVIYGGLANPNTLAATLNDKDVVNLFTRSEKRYEVVKIPLQPGENLLVLAVEGQTVDGPARDTDSLVFLVD